MSRSWHGMNDTQVREMWCYLDWEAVVFETLTTAAACNALPFEQRMRAIQLLDFSIREGGLRPPVMTNVPHFMSSTLIAMARPQKPKGWWARRRAKRALSAMLERLDAAHNIIATMAQFKAAAPVGGFAREALKGN